MPRPALILGSEPRVVVAVARSLASGGIPVHAGGFPPEPLRVRSRAIQRIVKLPSPELATPALVRKLVDEIGRGGYDIVFPCSDGALSTIMRVDEELRKIVHVACPPPPVIRKVLEKQATLDIAAGCGIPIPRQWHIGNPAVLEAVAGDLVFPLVAKPMSKRAAAGFKVRYLHSIAELRAVLSEDASFGSAHLLQQYCPGYGVGVEVLVHHGEPIALFQHRRLKEYPASGGVSVSARGEPLDPVLAEQALRLLRQLDWDGIAMVEFRCDPMSGAAVLMEVNGRFWGSLALSRRAGLEFPFYQWQLAHGQIPAPPQQYRTGAQFHWLVGDLRRALDLARQQATSRCDRVRQIWTQVLLLWEERRASAGDALWLRNDPLPAAMELGRFMLETVRIESRAALRAVLLRGFIGRIRRYLVRRSQARRLGVIEYLPKQELARIRKLVFVCHGNIMRSALAEGMLAALLRDRAGHHVSSAGLYAKPGTPADDRVVSFAAIRGVDIMSHRAKRLDQRLATEADMIFVMDYENAARILTDRPDLRGRVALLSSVLRRPGSSGREIPDPYLGSPEEVQRVLTEVESYARHLARALGAQPVQLN